MPKTAQTQQKYKVSYGGWYQRTTLHLSEIYDFLAFKKTQLPLSQSVLSQLHDRLHLKTVTREVGYLEFVKVIAMNGVEVRYYEDGLYILEIVSENVNKARKKLERYYTQALEPAIKYIFSLGAPTPKILADIKTVHPIVVGAAHKNHDQFQVDVDRYGYVYSKIVSHDVTVYKTPAFIFVISTENCFKQVKDIVEMQIFFREFKDQLQRYLDIHRVIWEEIDAIRDKKEVKGGDVTDIRMKLDSYKKTVTLISSRIYQMGTYVKTRASLAQDLKIEGYLVDLFQYKFEVLTNTLEYIKELWKMTTEYLASAIQIVIELQERKTNVSLNSLRFVTAFGVIAGFSRYTNIPELKLEGIIYFAGLIAVTFLIDRLLLLVYRSRKYQVKFAKRARSF